MAWGGRWLRACLVAMAGAAAPSMALLASHPHLPAVAPAASYSLAFAPCCLDRKPQASAHKDSKACLRPRLFWRRRKDVVVNMSGGGEAVAPSDGPQGAPLVRLAAYLTNLFPLWVLAGGVLGVTKPAALAWLRGDLITASLVATCCFAPPPPDPLQALTMLFMGMTLEVKDFQRVMQSPKQVFLGFMCQFSIMPFLGWSMAKLFGLPPAFAVGLILVSACPGGTASNLVTLIAKADVALSVLMTTVSTMAAPIMTPLLTSILAGSLVPVDASGLLISTLQVIIFRLVFLLSSSPLPLSFSFVVYSHAVLYHAIPTCHPNVLLFTSLVPFGYLFPRASLPVLLLL
eukprot:751097-Hanusia_phi.AAC.1